MFPEYYVLKVSEFDLKIKDTLDEWIYALQQSEVRPEFKAQGIQEAAEQLNILQLSESERSEYERHVGDNRDSKSIWRTYYGDGERAALVKIVLNMQRLELPASQISEFVKLSEEQVQEIISSKK